MCVILVKHVIRCFCLFFRNPKTLNRKMFIEALLGSFKNIFIFPTNVVIVIITILNDPIIGFLMLHLFEKNVCYFLWHRRESVSFFCHFCGDGLFEWPLYDRPDRPTLLTSSLYYCFVSFDNKSLFLHFDGIFTWLNVMENVRKKGKLVFL